MMENKQLTKRQIFDKYRSMYAMLHRGSNLYIKVQICGFYRDRFIVAFRGAEGAIETFRQGLLFDEGFFDGVKALSYDIVDLSQLVFIDTHATERLNY